MRVLLTGASGSIGRNLARRLLDEGDDVFVPKGQGTGQSGIIELADAEWADDIEALIRLDLFDTRTDAAPENAETVAAAARQAAESGVARFLLLSTAEVHPPDVSGPAIEEDCNPADDRAVAILKAEEALREALAGTGTRWTILRAAPLYGPEDAGDMATLARLAAGNIPLPVASFPARRSVLALDNLVDAILTARAHPAARDETFLIADDDAVTPGEFVEMARTGRGGTARKFSLPAPLARAWFGLLGHGDLSSRLSRSLVVDTSKARLRLGWRPRLTTRDALLAAARRRRA